MWHITPHQTFRLMLCKRTRDKSPLESIMVKIVDLNREINKCVDAFVDYKAVVWEQLDKLTDEREKQILWLACQ